MPLAYVEVQCNTPVDNRIRDFQPHVASVCWASWCNNKVLPKGSGMSSYICKTQRNSCHHQPSDLESVVTHSTQPLILRVVQQDRSSDELRAAGAALLSAICHAGASYLWSSTGYYAEEAVKLAVAGLGDAASVSTSNCCTVPLVLWWLSYSNCVLTSSWEKCTQVPDKKAVQTLSHFLEPVSEPCCMSTACVYIMTASNTRSVCPGLGRPCSCRPVQQSSSGSSPGCREEAS